MTGLSPEIWCEVWKAVARRRSAVARPRLCRWIAAQSLLPHFAANGETPHVLKCAERLRDEMAFAIADLAFAIGHRGRTVQHTARCAQLAAAGLHEVHLHFDRDDADTIGS